MLRHFPPADLPPHHEAGVTPPSNIPPRTKDAHRIAAH
jgi:hypothetical protein